MQDLFNQFVALFKDLPGFLDGFIQAHGPWVYALLFGIVFVETGLVVMPFLPGDSLLFTVGALSARESMRESMNVWTVSILLIVAAGLGDNVNYFIGRAIGPRVFRKEGTTGFWSKLLSRKHLDRAHAFYEKHGGKAIFLGHFVPIIRTFAPFVAGAGSMDYRKFVFYNVTGVIAWVSLCVGAGYFFGNLEFVKKNFEMVVLAIIVVSLIPVAVEFIRGMSGKSPSVVASIPPAEKRDAA